MVSTLFRRDGPDPVRDAPSVAGTADGPSQRLHRSMNPLHSSPPAHLATMHLLPACIVDMWVLDEPAEFSDRMGNGLVADRPSQISNSSLQTIPPSNPNPDIERQSPSAAAAAGRANTGRSRIATPAALLSV